MTSSIGQEMGVAMAHVIARPPAMILAGGRARRMGGGDKPLLPLRGRTLLDHVIERLRPQAGALALNANGEPARFAFCGLPVLPDPVPDQPGPLAGILAAMVWARSLDTVVLTVPGDTPSLPGDLVARLSQALAGSEAPVAIAASRGRPHPVIALWSVDLVDALAAALARGERRVGGFAAAHGAVEVPFPAEPIDPFANINTPDDLARAETVML